VTSTQPRLLSKHDEPINKARTLSLPIPSGCPIQALQASAPAVLQGQLVHSNLRPHAGHPPLLRPLFGAARTPRLDDCAPVGQRSIFARRHQFLAAWPGL